MVPFFLSLFPATGKSAWLTQVLNESKAAQRGDNEYERLRWHTEEGFTIEPYYTTSDLAEGPLAPSQLTTIQAAQKQSPGWLNAPEHKITDEKSDNVILRDALARGADALVLNLPIAANNLNDSLSRLLSGIKLSDTPVFFRLASGHAHDLIKALKIVAPYNLKGGLLLDAGDSTAEVTRLTADSPQFRTVCVNSHTFHNAGATATQELAFTLASLADAYDQLTDSGLTLEQLVPKTMLSVSVGTSYFMEIAKLRALRVLFARFTSAYSSAPLPPLFIHSQTSIFYDAKATPNTNLLRATTEAMAAVIGGCDALTVHPFDTVLGTPTSADRSTSATDFSARIARNVSILLKQESYLDKVADPAAGSYYSELLTHSLVEAAWTLFLTVEKQGGFAKALANGFVQTEIEQAYQAKVQAVRNGKVLVGVTKFRFDEPNIQLYTAPERVTGLLPERRLAEDFE
ncbi:methylmalonyl-CoA mutase [Spirosoma radiotolerans]|uniref:Methylmalonyl-CoA mutase n=2 Tax=Spirosoma radiotolerans TaxID=1379870 RepID=A0A0E4A067_9BACT|nr:methylmalonyl-CoA mutase [Spirosoma radiotolerans]